MVDDDMACNGHGLEETREPEGTRVMICVGYLDRLRTVRTGQEAVATTREATLPSTRRVTPERP